MSQQARSVFSLTVIATAAITAYRFAQSDGTLAAAGENALGVARSAAASGDPFPVDVLGTAIVELGGTVVVGDSIKSDATGRGVLWATSGAKIAIALQAGTVGQFVEMLLIPNVA